MNNKRISLMSNIYLMTSTGHVPAMRIADTFYARCSLMAKVLRFQRRDAVRVRHFAQKNKMKAEDCKCCKCGIQAVAFWPVIDPDIPQHAYCRKCLDDAKFKLLIRLQKITKMR